MVMIRMINKRLACKLINSIWVAGKLSDADKRNQNAMVKAVDDGLMLNDFYKTLGDLRQGVIVAMYVREAGELIDELIAAGDDFDKAAKLITTSNWGKRKANRKAACSLSEQYATGKYKKCCGRDCGK